jgi:hypothetical protein
MVMLTTAAMLHKPAATAPAAYGRAPGQNPTPAGTSSESSSRPHFDVVR